MPQIFNGCLALVLVLCTTTVFGGQVDLALTAAVDSAGPYQPGQRVHLSLTVTNLGPDVAGQDVPGDPVLPVQFSSPVSVDEANRLPTLVQPLDPIACPVEYVPFDPPPGMRGGILNVIYQPRLLVSESRTCVLLVEIDEAQVVGPSMTWRVTSQLDVDPNTTNNTQVVAFPLQSRSIPFASPTTLALLLAAMLILSLYALRK